METSIFFGTIDTVELEARVAAKYFELTGKQPNPGDPEFAINATIAYVYALAQESIERAGKANLVAFATGANLDYIGELVGLSRISSTASVVRFEATLSSGHPQLVIPGGTLVSSQDGLGVFETNEDVTVPVGTDVVLIDATCTTAGSFSNGFAIGTVKIIQNPQPYLVSMINVDVSSGGGDVETDESFRARWATALEALSVAGPKGAYEFYALSASPTIVSVKIIGPEDVGYGVVPGDVEIRVLVDTGVPTPSIINLVQTACDPDTVRPLCDTVRVFAADPIVYSLAVNVIAFVGADTATLAARVQTSIQEYCTAQGNSIGADIVEDALTVAGKIAGEVKSLSFVGFTDIAVNLRQFARCSSISVTITAVEEP